MKYIVALSGGVDSVVLLDMLVKSNEHELIVAHFDHGIREDSDADARFCWELAKKYHLPFEVRREELGEAASEAMARERRYIFLNEIATKYNARTVTAHHQDDLIETIAINCARGTGWRGLAVLGNEQITRPLLSKRKHELYDYALEQGLEWVEDETNQSDKYMRNKLRRHVRRLDESSRRELIKLYKSQTQLRKEIEARILLFTPQFTSRSFFKTLDPTLARELLHSATQGRLTRPQLDRFYEGLITLNSGATMTIGGGLIARLTKDTFSLDTLESLYKG